LAPRGCRHSASPSKVGVGDDVGPRNRAIADRDAETIGEAAGEVRTKGRVGEIEGEGQALERPLLEDLGAVGPLRLVLHLDGEAGQQREDRRHVLTIGVLRLEEVDDAGGDVGRERGADTTCGAAVVDVDLDGLGLEERGHLALRRLDEAGEVRVEILVVEAAGGVAALGTQLRRHRHPTAAGVIGEDLRLHRRRRQRKRRPLIRRQQVQRREHDLGGLVAHGEDAGVLDALLEIEVDTACGGHDGGGDEGGGDEAVARHVQNSPERPRTGTKGKDGIACTSRER
jgi:hypothetical protein